MRTKSVEQSIRDTTEPEHQLRKDLGALDLVVFGVGVIIGAGIFVLTGQQAAASAGPAVAVSFLVAGVACALAVLCYAEFASTVPVAGSAYTFAYATFGEFAFVLVSVGVVILRRTRPDLPRAFRVPAAPVVAALAVVACVYLMLNLIGETWLGFGIWMALGLVLYFAYGVRRSRLADQETEVRQPTG